MKKAIALLALCLAVAFSQQVYPASTNPDGASYFAPSLVRTMNISTTVTGTVTPGYQEFIQVWIPSYVGAVRYILNNTVPSTGEGNYIEIHVSMIESDFDSSVSFPCSSTSGNAACDDYDLYIDAYTNSWDSSVVDVIDEDYIPGTWHYITVYTYYSSGSDVTYALRVEPAFACAENGTVAILDSDELGCVENSTITHVASNGAAFAGALLSDSQFDIYRVEIPQNVSRVWAWLTGSFSYNYFIVNQGVASVDYYYGSIAYQSSGSSVGNGFYTFRIEVELPTYNLPLFFSVVPYSSSYLGSYNVTFHWSYCGSTSAGLGEDSNDYGDAVTTFPDTPDCNDPVTVPALNGTSLQTVNFAIQAYNATEDYGYVGSYGFMHIPDGSYGSVNFTCNSTSDETFVTFTKGKPSSCYSDYTYYIYCNGPTYTTSNYFRLLSEDLYVGGYWSVAACSDDSVASTVSLLSNGYFPLPSPSATPSASVTPSSSASSSASPSATPSVSSSPEPDSDSSAFLFPAILMVALAVIISL